MDDTEIKHLRNPAGRLYIVLSKLKSKVDIQDSEQIVACYAWKDILNLDAFEVDFTVLNKINQVMSLPDEIIYWVKKLELDKALFIDKWYKPFREAADKFSLQGNLFSFTREISDTCLTSLAYVSHDFNLRNLEPEIKIEQITKIKEDIKNLIETVINSKSLDQQLQEYLLWHLDMLLRSVRDYYICGITPVQNTVKTIIGSFATDNVPKQSKDNEFLIKFWNLTNKIAITFTVYEAGSKLLEYKNKLPDLFLEWTK